MDQLDFDEVAAFRESRKKASAIGLLVMFVGGRRLDCNVIVLVTPQFRPVHAVEFTGDYVTDLSYLWKSFDNMGQLESRFGCLNTPTRWHCNNIGVA